MVIDELPLKHDNRGVISNLNSNHHQQVLGAQDPEMLSINFQNANSIKLNLSKGDIFKNRLEGLNQNIFEQPKMFEEPSLSNNLLDSFLPSTTNFC